MTTTPLTERIAAAIGGHWPITPNNDGTVICHCGDRVKADRQRQAFREHTAAAVLAVVQPELDRLAPAQALHAEVPLYKLAEDCPHGEPDDDQPEQGDAWAERHPFGMDDTGYTGDRVCLDSPIGRSVCGTCLDPDCPEDPAPWPCTTATALGLAAVSPSA